jgi:hypothetical protein
MKIFAALKKQAQCEVMYNSDHLEGESRCAEASDMQKDIVRFQLPHLPLRLSKPSNSTSSKVTRISADVLDEHTAGIFANGRGYDLDITTTGATACVSPVPSAIMEPCYVWSEQPLHSSSAKKQTETGEPESPTDLPIRPKRRHDQPYDIRFSDIIGHASVKLRIDELILPLGLPSIIADSVLKGIRSIPASILLYGPPGCGKVG